MHLGTGFAGCTVVITLHTVKTTAIVWCPLQGGNPVPLGQQNGIFFTALKWICKPLMFTCFVIKLMSIHPLKNLIKVCLWQAASRSLDSTLGADDLIGVSSRSLLLPHLFVSTSCVTKINCSEQELVFLVLLGAMLSGAQLLCGMSQPLLVAATPSPLSKQVI